MYNLYFVPKDMLHITITNINFHIDPKRKEKGLLPPQPGFVQSGFGFPEMIRPD